MDLQIHTNCVMRSIYERCRYSRRQLLKSIVVMKLALFLITISLQLSAATYAQDISLNFKNAELRDVLQSIRKQSGYSFVIDGNDLKNANPVTITLKSSSIETTLHSLFENQPFTYKVEGKLIMIKPKTSSVPLRAENGIRILTDIKGIITDEQGNPLSGATVMVIGTKLGAVTDNEGRFIINDAPQSGTLIITMLGHSAKEVAYKNGKIPNIVLNEADQTLKEIVIAYGKIEEKFKTSNVGVISGDVISKQPITNPLLALQGRTPGLYIQQSSGTPGGAVSVVVQGKNSLTQGNTPFYVIDGVPYTPEAINQGVAVWGGSLGNPSTSNLNFINPADIESITVLKDADATAIYGSRAANGAILITTKKGKAGETKVDVNLQTGWGKIAMRPRMMNIAQYLALRHEAKRNGNAVPRASDYDMNGVWDTTRNVDWQKEMLGGTSQYQNLQAAISGGSERTQFLAGTGYLRETTVYPGDYSNVKSSVHFNINHSSKNQKFRFYLSGSYLQSTNKLPYGDFTDAATGMAPDAPPLFNSDGSINWAPHPDNPDQYTFNNPAAALLSSYKTKNNNLIGNSQISYEVIPGLVLKSSFGYNNLTTDELLTNPIATIRPDEREGTKRSASYSDKFINSWIIEPQITFNKKYAWGSVDALFGTTFQETDNYILTIRGNDYASDALLKDPNAAAIRTIEGSLQSTYRYNAVFGRLNYRYNDRYIVNLTARRDGSSRFGAENLMNNFYSVGGAWLFSEEDIIKKSIPFMNLGKIRATYGTTGNDQIGDYQFYSLYDLIPGIAVPYQNSTGLVPRGLSNAYLQWEETRKFNLGLDLSFFESRFSLTANYYRNRSSNQLLGQTLSVVTGFGGITRNLPATVQNTGWEISIDGSPIKRVNFNWQISANITVPKNRLVRYDGLEVSADRNIYVLGKSVNIARVYSYSRVNPETGLYEFWDSKGGLTSSPDEAMDKSKVIDLNPKFYGGVSNNFSYKGFDLDVFFDFVSRNSSTPKYMAFPGADNNRNVLAAVENRWRKPGDQAVYQKVTSRLGEIYPSGLAIQESDASYINLTYTRLKNVSLSYNFSKDLLRKVHIANARLFVQGQNLATFTNLFGGSDPEVASFGTLGTLRVMTIGTQITF